MRFIIENPQDEIQRFWAAEKFYEEQELADIRTLSQPGWRILDIGSNVGNHAIYFDKFLNPEVVFAIEPDIKSYKILLQNAALNYCHKINFDYLGIAFNNREKKLCISHSEENNLGATQFIEDELGTYPSTTGDSIFADQKIDFIKIDVEGMEIQVIEGLYKTIELNKPAMFIEVQNNNISKFLYFVKAFKYKIIKTYRSYTTCENFLIQQE